MLADVSKGVGRGAVVVSPMTWVVQPGTASPRPRGVTQPVFVTRGRFIPALFVTTLSVTTMSGGGRHRGAVVRLLGMLFPRIFLASALFVVGVAGVSGSVQLPCRRAR